MRTLRETTSSARWLLIALLVLATLFLTAECRGGRGGGGSRGGSRGSSSRGSSSGSRRGGSNPWDNSRSRPAPAPPAPPPPVYKPPPPKPSPPKVQQPAHNPNFKETGAAPQPPPYSPRVPPPPYSPSAGGQPPQPGFRQPNPGPAQPGGVPGANYPRQPGMAPQPGVAPPAYPGGVPGANYPRQPGIAQPGVAPPAYPGGVPGANYPRQPGMAQPGVAPPAYPGGSPGANYPRQPGMAQPGVAPPAYPGGSPGANYPRQPGMAQPGVAPPAHIGGVSYPRAPGSYHQPGPGGIAGANYPRQPSAPLGGNVWHPQSGMPAPAYMNYGGLPTGANMYSKPHKNKGFLGSLMSMGSHKGSSKKNKYYGSYPGPYGASGMGGHGMGGMGGFMGNKGSKAAMYTILPYMAARRSSSLFRPRFGFMPIFLPSPFHYHSYGYGYGYGGYGHGYGRTHYDVYNSDYVGRCNKPLTPLNGKVVCNSTNKEVDCDVTCEEGYVFPDNTTHKLNKCWHVTGIWKPEKNFPACKAVCKEECLNGGSCATPGKCGCPAEYRGPHCEFHFLKCDVRSLAVGFRIKWVCAHTKNETVCRIKCYPPAEFETPPQEEYRCTPEGVWTPKTLPKCIKPSEITNSTIIPTTEETSKRK